MGFKDLHLKFKAFQLKRFLTGDAGKKKRGAELGNRPSWMVPVSHGFYVVDAESNGDNSASDSVVVQREQIGELELWFFGVSDATIGDGITKYLQSHLFDKKPKQNQLRKKSKETMRKAYLSVRGKAMREKEEEVEGGGGSAASAIVINGEKLVMGDMGDYRAVVCRDGEAHQYGNKSRHWSRKLLSGVLGKPRVPILSCGYSTKLGNTSELVVGDEEIDSDTEFVILGSTGIWDVMKHQEAVNLIGHLEDPQEAAECLAKEALTRMSRSSISCLIIRFG